MSYAHERFMREAIEFAQTKNPIWPFSALLVNETGEI